MKTAYEIFWVLCVSTGMYVLGKTTYDVLTLAVNRLLDFVIPKPVDPKDGE